MLIALQELSQQCSRFHTELVAPDITNCEDEMLEFWPETERRVNKLQRTTGPPYGCLLDV